MKSQRRNTWSQHSKKKLHGKSGPEPRIQKGQREGTTCTKAEVK